MEGLEIYDALYERSRDILGGHRHLDWCSIEAAPEPTEEQFKEWAEWAATYFEHPNRGLVRTLLVIGKPYKTNPLMEPTLTRLADYLRSTSPNGRI